MQTFRQRLDAAIAAHALLRHPFYQAWTCGTLPRESLRAYAAQYFHHVQAFPTYVSAVHARCGADLEARRSLLENLIEEERGDKNHAALWADFAAGIGVPDAAESAPTPETLALIETLRGLTARKAGEGAAALYAYESQVPKVADAKIAGLRDQYGLTDPKALAFFEVHRTLDVHHSDATCEISERLSSEPPAQEAAIAASEQAAAALWKFLDQFAVAA
jgi:pyrroloquinoline-quinone synthase